VQDRADAIAVGIQAGLYPPDAGVDSTDQTRVIADVPAFVRALLADTPSCAGTLIAIGASASASDLHDLLWDVHGLGRGVFDGTLLLGLEFGSGKSLSANVPAPPAGTGRIIALDTEGDIQQGWGVGVRARYDNYRDYEVAGVPHASPEVIDICAALSGLPEYPCRQDPVRYGPVVRRMLGHLEGWLAGVPPPEPSYIEGPFDGAHDDLFLGSEQDPYIEIDRDADGNVRGGIRLPHLGAPLGSFTGMETSTPKSLGYAGYDTLSFGVSLGGTFVPFAAGEMARRYPTHKAYCDAVTAAASQAYVDGWISALDEQAYVDAAQRCSVGTVDPATLTREDLEACLVLP
jgi:hypothetical protein